MREGKGAKMYCEELIRKCCQQVRNLRGDAAEVGTYRGEAAWLICEMLPGATVHLFDTLTGIPPQCEAIDDCKAGEFQDTSEQVVHDKLKGRKYELHLGVFPQTAVDVPVKFVHIDCDIYRSTRDACAWAWDHLVPGGIMLCDDYGSQLCRGAKQAIDEFLTATPKARVNYWDRRAIISKEA